MGDTYRTIEWGPENLGMEWVDHVVFANRFLVQELIDNRGVRCRLYVYRNKLNLWALALVTGTSVFKSYWYQKGLPEKYFKNTPYHQKVKEIIEQQEDKR